MTTHHLYPRGSALILTVVLTTLLAIVGVLFVLTSRLDKLGSTATTQSRQLDMAVDTVITLLSDELVRDVPGVDGQEYYDYPDANNAWLSSLEPNEQGSDWHQISRLSNVYDPAMYREVAIEIVLDRVPIPIANVNPNNGEILVPTLTDADGDGIGDAYWFKLNDFSTSYGRPVYAALRVIDHGAMINVNTAYAFNLESPELKNLLTGKAGYDGSTVMQINLLPLIYDPTLGGDGGLMDLVAGELHRVRSSLDTNSYLRQVVWGFGDPDRRSQLFDISDEMELRNRYFLNHDKIKTRIEDANRWEDICKESFIVPREDFDEWFDRITCSAPDATVDPNYNRRHISTTWNMDRLIDPNGEAMVNVNSASVEELYEALYNGIWSDPNDANSESERKAIAAQMAVNIVDSRDTDFFPSALSLQNVMDANSLPMQGPLTYYGMEVHPFISEVAFRVDPNDPENRSNYALELFNPSSVRFELNDLNFKLHLYPHNSQSVREISLDENFEFTTEQPRFVIDNLGVTESNQTKLTFKLAEFDQNSGALTEYYDVYLVTAVGGETLYLDVIETEPNWFTQNIGVWQSASRDDTGWKVAYLDHTDPVTEGLNQASLGSENMKPSIERPPFSLLEPDPIIRTFFNRRFHLTNIGEIGRFLVIGPSTDPNTTIGAKLTQFSNDLKNVFFDIANPRYAGVFQYLTVLDPAIYNSSEETRVKGRININTAPWFVLQRLPWLSHTYNQTGTNIAQAITRYRDDEKNNKQPGFESISDLMRVSAMEELERDGLSNQWFGYPPEYTYDPNDPNSRELGPDMTPDIADDDLEERDLLFTRISNLITVRSDVFSAYIVVRMGTDGPQKRMLAILDRSEVNSIDDRVRVLALQPIPDAR